MDEATWRTTDDPLSMLEYAREFAPVAHLLLYGCACVRQAWGVLPPECQETIELIEQCAEAPGQSGGTRRARELAARSLRGNPTSPAIQALALLPAEFALQGLDGWRPPCSPAVQCDLARCVFGNPHRPVSATPSWAMSEPARLLAQAIRDEHRYAELPILGDALEDAGCDDAEVLAHCRDALWHGRGCWVIRLLLKPE